MSRSIDTKVVEMKFENSKFEKNVQTSLNTIDTLKKSLNLDGATKGLENIKAKAGKIDMNPLKEAVDKVGVSFSALQVVAATALSNITNMAISYGARIVNAITGPLIQGGIRRAMNIEQAQFQLRGLGMDVEEVMANALSAVEGTAYGLDEAVRVASQLGASGIQAGEDMTRSLRAVAGVAAMTSSQYDDMGRIFTTVAGNGRLMGQQLLQLSSRGINAAASIAQYLGKTEQEVRSMVSQGEISFEIFSNAMDAAFGEHAQSANKLFTGAMANARVAIARIGADIAMPGLENMRDIFNALRPAIVGVHEVLRPFIADIVGVMALNTERIVNILENVDHSSLPYVFQGIQNALKGVMSVLRPIGEAFRQIFPPTTTAQVMAVAQAFENITSRFKMSDEGADQLRRTFAGLFAIFDIGIRLKTSLAGVVIELLGHILPLSGGILGLTANIGDAIVRFNDFTKSTDAFNVVINHIRNGIMMAVDYVRTFIQAFHEAFLEFANIDTTAFDNFTGNILLRLEPFGMIGRILQAAVRGIGTIFSNLGPVFMQLGSIMGQAFAILSNVLLDALNTRSFQPILDLINTILLGGIFLGVRNFINTITSLASSGEGVLGGITGILDGVKGSLLAWQTQLRANALLKIAGAIAILTVSLLLLTTICPQKLTIALGAITVMLTQLFGSLMVIEKSMGLSGIMGLGKIVGAIMGLSVALLILTVAVRSLASLEWDELARGLVGLGGMLAVLIGFSAGLDRMKTNLTRGSIGLIFLATAVLILSVAVSNLAALSWSELARGLTGLLGILVLLAGVSKGFGNAKGLIRTAIAMTILGGAILIFAIGIERMGSLDWGTIARGLGTMAGTLTAVAIAMNIMPKGMVTKAIGLTIVAASLLILGKAIQSMGGMSWEDIGRGLTAMGGALLAIGIGMHAMPKNIAVKAVGLIIVASALHILGAALKSMGDMSWEEIGRGMVVLGGSLLIISVGMGAMRRALPGAAALIVVTTALAIFVPVLRALGAMSIREIVTGLSALAGTFVIFGIAGALLTKVVPTLLGLGIAIGLFGIGIASAGAGVLLFSIGLTGLSVALIAFAGSLVMVLTSILGAIPLIFEILDRSIVALATVLENAIPILVQSLVTVIIALCEGLVEVYPVLANTMFTILYTALRGLADHIEPLVIALLDVIIGVLQGLEARLPQLVEATVSLLRTFFETVFGQMSGSAAANIFTMIGATAALGVLFMILAAVGAKAKKAMMAVVLMSTLLLILTAVFLIMSTIPVETTLGIAIGLSIVLLTISAMMLILALIPIKAALMAIANLAIAVVGLIAILALLGGLAQIPGLKWLLEEGAAMMEQVGDAIGSFFGSIVGGFMTGVTSALPQIGNDLAAFMDNAAPFFDGIQGIDQSALSGVRALAQTVLILTAANILDGLTSWFTGGSSIVEFGRELAEFGPYLMSFSNSVAGIDGAAIEASANAAQTLSEFARNLPREGGLVQLITGENSITQFAEELSIFGPHLMNYANTVSGLDADVVVSSAYAATALAEFAEKIPKQGGLVGLITGENSITQFAEELSIFGPHLMAYATSVTGLDADVVMNSVVAAQALAEFAEHVPDRGGLVNLITGDNSIAVFAEELAIFGPHLMSYAESVSGLDASVVVNSANAAMALTELANNVPDSGGIFDWFNGSNDIGEFGSSLAIFGQYFAQYSGYMSSVDVGVVNATTAVAESIIALANGLPTTGGWFSSDVTLADFGRDLSAFGLQMRNYSDNIAGINVGLMSAVIRETHNLLDLARGMSGLDTSAVSGFGRSLTDLGNNGIDGFIQAFTDAVSRVQAAATGMLDDFITAMGTRRNNLQNAGRDAANAALRGIENRRSAFTTEGQTLANRLSGGLMSRNSAIANAFTGAINNTITAVRNQQITFHNAGAHLANGLVNGLNSRSQAVTNAATALTRAATSAVNRAAQIMSPSRITYRSGVYMALGLCNALMDYAKNAYDAGAYMAKKACAGLSDAIAYAVNLLEDEIDHEPTIRPVLDLSEIQNGFAGMDRLFGERSYAIAGHVGSISSSKPIGEIVEETIRSAISAMKDHDDGPSEVTYVLDTKVDIDGREVARSIAPYSQEELDRRNKIAWRKRGVV